MSASSSPDLAHSKGPTRRRIVARRKRKECTVIASVRAQVLDRDGYCRLLWHDDHTRAVLSTMFGPCVGRSEWAHYNATHRRSKTRGQDPEKRHDRRYSLMLCQWHSQEYDQNRMSVVGITDRCCDGPLRFERFGESWIEPRT